MMPLSVSRMGCLNASGIPLKNAAIYIRLRTEGVSTATRFAILYIYIDKLYMVSKKTLIKLTQQGMFKTWGHALTLRRTTEPPYYRSSNDFNDNLRN